LALKISLDEGRRIKERDTLDEFEGCQTNKRNLLILFEAKLEYKLNLRMSSIGSFQPLL
jgi:hypothetical protein